jgi:hypothetical protein
MRRRQRRRMRLIKFRLAETEIEAGEQGCLVRFDFFLQFREGY